MAPVLCAPLAQQSYSILNFRDVGSGGQGAQLLADQLTLKSDAAKGQLISKCLFGVSNSPKKRT